MSKKNGQTESLWDQSSECLWWSKRLKEEVCFKCRVKKRRSDWWWQRWWWQCGSDVCRVVRWKTRMWMRLTERAREFIPKVGCCMLKRTVCNFERWGSRWSGYVDNRRGSSTARKLNSDQCRKIRRLRGSKWEREAGNRISDPGGMQGWVDLGNGYIWR